MNLMLNQNPKDPWDWYIYLHEWLIFMVGKYTSPMDPMGNISMNPSNSIIPTSANGWWNVRVERIFWMDVIDDS